MKTTVEIEIELRPFKGQATCLTSAQRNILRLTALSLTPPQIGDVLQLSAKTVEYHRGHAMKLLGIEPFDFPAIVRFAVREKLIRA